MDYLPYLSYVKKVINHLVKFQDSSDFVCRKKIRILCFWLQFCSFLAIFVGFFGPDGQISPKLILNDYFILRSIDLHKKQ